MNSLCVCVCVCVRVQLAHAMEASLKSWMGRKDEEVSHYWILEDSLLLELRMVTRIGIDLTVVYTRH